MQASPREGGKAALKILDNGVLCLTWQAGAAIEAEDIASAMAEVNNLSGRVPRPLLVEMSDIATITHHARAALSKPCAASHVALLGSTPVDRLIASFRADTSYPCPTRFFTVRAEAISWLLQEF